MEQRTSKKPLLALLSFWVFVTLFKFGASLHYTIMPAFGERVLPVWVVGLIIGGAAVVQLLLDVPVGFALDRFGYVRLLRVGCISFLIAAAFLVTGLTPLTFAATALFGTIGWLIYGPGITAYVIGKASHEEAAQYVGILGVAQSLGVVLGTAALTVALRLPVPVTAVAVAATIFVSFLFLNDASAHVPETPNSGKVRHQAYHIRRRPIHHIVRTLKKLNPASSMLAVQNFAGGVFYGTVWFTVPLVLVQGFGHSLPSISLSIFDFAIVVLGAALGALADKFAKRPLVIAGLLIFTVAGAITGFTLNAWFLLFGFLATAGDELSNVSLWGWLAHLDRAHSEDGLVNGALSMFQDLGWAVGPAIAGFTFSSFGPSWTIAIGASVLGVAWLWAMVALRHPTARVASLERYGRAPLRHRHKR